MGQRLFQGASGIANAQGAVAMTLPSPPPGFVWTGTLQVPNSDNSAVWLAAVSSQTIGTFRGTSTYGPLTVIGREEISVTGTGLTAGQAYNVILIGNSDLDDGSIKYASPVSSSQSSVSLASGSSVGLTTGTQVGVNNPYVVQGGPNQVATLTTPTGSAASGTVINAPDSAHAIELFAFVGTFVPAATGNYIELHSQISSSSYYTAYRGQWAANAAIIPISVFLGGYIMAAGQPLTYLVGTAGLSDVNLSLYYRVVPYP